jgi:hypothetical protein
VSAEGEVGEAGLSPADARLVEDFLLRAETTLALVDSLTPHNFADEAARVRALLGAGRIGLPAFRFDSEDGANERREKAEEGLNHAFLRLSDRRGWLVDLLVERALELRLECDLVRARGTADVSELARRRYPFSAGEVAGAAAQAEAWLDLVDDRGSTPESEDCLLASALARRCREAEAKWGANVRIVEKPLASVAAVGSSSSGQGVLYVRSGARVSEREASRIFVHEVEGHLLPRLFSMRQPPPFRIGTAGCSEDEEGRAILLEERAGLLSPVRRLTLAVRYLVGTASRSGGPELESVLFRLQSRGVPAPLLADVVLRSLRGGGWGREMIYLPAFLRVREALAARPDWDDWMARGRISVRGARALSTVCG